MKLIPDEEEKTWRFVANSEELKRSYEIGNITPNGIIYDYELAGSMGADFYLFPATWHTKEDIEEAKEYLRTQHDVVSLYIGHIDGEYPIPQYPPDPPPDELEAAFREVLATHTAKPVGNCAFVDVQSANAVCLVLDNLKNPKNRAKFLTMPASKMVEIAWRLVTVKIG